MDAVDVKRTSGMEATPEGVPRFAFGANWRRYLPLVDERRVDQAVLSLRTMLGRESLQGRSFLDVGCGSGLFSLAARRSGAVVRSFDLDPLSVLCTRQLRHRFLPEDREWAVEQGSILDREFVRSLGQFDIVYSWGYLHHTGDMWTALELTGSLVRPGGTMLIALYNDQGRRSRFWAAVKRTYCRTPWPLKPLILGPAAVYFLGPGLLHDLLTLRPLQGWRRHHHARGMSPWHDLVDWVGGYPFEVATPEAVFDFLDRRGYRLRRLKTVGGDIGNNEFVFERVGVA